MITIAVLQNFRETLDFDILDIVLYASCKYELLVPDCGVARRELRCDVCVASPGWSGSAGIGGAILVSPYGAGGFVSGAREVVTYGMHPRASVSFSSLGFSEYMLEVRREVVTCENRSLWEAEFPVPRVRDFESGLAKYAALLAAGVLPGDAARIYSGGDAYR
ncbi:MAG: hypothetical protein LBS90_07155 [Oscillospiraceae bacterium]|nr:hypothetical protein [Oscillospiraceae bacterium]